MKQHDVLIITGAQGTGKSLLARFIASLSEEVSVFDPLDESNIEFAKRAHANGEPIVIVAHCAPGDVFEHTDGLTRRLANALVINLQGFKTT